MCWEALYFWNEWYFFVQSEFAADLDCSDDAWFLYGVCENYVWEKLGVKLQQPLCRETLIFCEKPPKDPNGIKAVWERDVWREHSPAVFKIPSKSVLQMNKDGMPLCLCCIFVLTRQESVRLLPLQSHSGSITWCQYVHQPTPALWGKCSIKEAAGVHIQRLLNSKHKSIMRDLSLKRKL